MDNKGNHDEYDPSFVRLCIDAVKTTVRRKYERLKNSND